MKKIEGTIFVECDVCWDLDTWTSTCYICGHTVCIICLRKEKFVCPVCGVDFQEPIPIQRTNDKII